MENLLRKLQETNRKAAKLERLILRLQEDNGKLQEQLRNMQKAVEAKDEAYSEMKEKYEAVKLVKHIDNDQDKAAIQAKIDLYIKEIDACLRNFGE